MFAIMRTKKLKTNGNIAGVQGHNMRTRVTNNADPKKINENRILVGSKNILDDVNQRYFETKCKERKNGVKAIEVFLSASPEFFQSNYFKLDDFNEQAVEWLRKIFGSDNVINVTLHMDETTPHLHAVVTPIVKSKNNKYYKQSAKTWLDGKAKLSKLQDSFADAVSDLGLSRGIKGSIAKHTKISKFYAEIQKDNVNLKKKDFKIESPSIFNVLTKKQKVKYTEDQTNSIITNIKPAYITLKNQANISVLANKKKKEYQDTALKLQAENERLEAKLIEVENFQISVAQLKLENDFLGNELEIALREKQKLASQLKDYTRGMKKEIQPSLSVTEKFSGNRPDTGPVM